MSEFSDNLPLIFGTKSLATPPPMHKGFVTDVYDL